MNGKTINKILLDTAYIRTGGSKEEKRCAEYLTSVCEQNGFCAKKESFGVTMYDTKVAKLTVDGKDIPCTGYWGAANKAVKAELYYLRGTDNLSLKMCKDKIVLLDNALGYAIYDKLVANGAIGVITYNGNLYFNDRDIDQKEIRFTIQEENRIPAVNIHVDDAFDVVKGKGKIAEIILEHTQYIGESSNVILDLEGKTDETIVISAHYDSTALSTGAYDNMSGCIGLLYLAEYFSSIPHKRRIRLLWCGSEERGLLGSLEYCRMHKDELKNTVLNINLDMLGSVMGEFVAFSCVNEEMTDFLADFFAKHGFPASIRHAIRSSDSNSFVYYDVPAVSFARYAPSNIGSIHTRYDRSEMISDIQLLEDLKIIAEFSEHFANSVDFGVPMNISEKIKTDVEKYMTRKISSVCGGGE